MFMQSHVIMMKYMCYILYTVTDIIMFICQCSTLKRGGCEYWIYM